jgi:hypothetical protein
MPWCDGKRQAAANPYIEMVRWLRPEQVTLVTKF